MTPEHNFNPTQHERSGIAAACTCGWEGNAKRGFMDEDYARIEWASHATKALRRERDEALAALERVRALHVVEDGRCLGCCDNTGNPCDAPCPTLAAIEGGETP